MGKSRSIGGHLLVLTSNLLSLAPLCPLRSVAVVRAVIVEKAKQLFPQVARCWFYKDEVHEQRRRSSIAGQRRLLSASWQKYGHAEVLARVSGDASRVRAREMGEFCAMARCSVYRVSTGVVLTVLGLSAPGVANVLHSCAVGMV